MFTKNKEKFREIISCQYCKNEFSALKSKKRKFCSKSCQSSFIDKTRIRSEQEKEKLRNRRLGMKFDEEWRNNLRKSHVGKINTPEQIENWKKSISKSDIFRNSLKSSERNKKISEKMSIIMKEKYRNGQIKHSSSSKSELEFGKRINEIFGVKLEHHKWLCGKCFDFKVPNKQILIECDGSYWHSRTDSKINDNLKDQIATNYGFTVIRFVLDRQQDVNKLITENSQLLQNLLGQNVNRRVFSIRNS